MALNARRLVVGGATMVSLSLAVHASAETISLLNTWHGPPAPAPAGSTRIFEFDDESSEADQVNEFRGVIGDNLADVEDVDGEEVAAAEQRIARAERRLERAEEKRLAAQERLDDLWTFRP